MKAIIQTIVQETPDVMSFEVETPEPVTFKTGQCMRWDLPDVAARRLFSIAQPGGTTNRLWFTIKIENQGRFTPSVAKLRVGDTIEVRGPFGKFTFDSASPGDIALIGGGVGISLLRAIYLDVIRNAPAKKIHLLYSIRNEQSFIYRAEIERLAKEHPEFTFTIVVTQPTQNWTGLHGRITAEILKSEFGSLQQTFFVCGPKAFNDVIEKYLQQAGVPNERILIDRWTLVESLVQAAQL